MLSKYTATSAVHAAKRMATSHRSQHALDADTLGKRRQRIVAADRPLKLALRRLIRNRPRTLHSDIPTFQRNRRPARRSNADPLGRRKIHIHIRRHQLQVLLGHQLEHVVLGLHVDVVLPRRELQADVVVTCLRQTGSHADRLAGVHARLLANREVGVLPAAQRDAFAIGQLQVLPRHHDEARAAGQVCDGFALVRHFALRAGGVVAALLVERGAIALAGGALPAWCGRNARFALAVVERRSRRAGQCRLR